MPYNRKTKTYSCDLCGHDTPRATTYRIHLAAVSVDMQKRLFQQGLPFYMCESCALDKYGEVLAKREAFNVGATYTSEENDGDQV